MKFLLTNDDGVDAEGLAALEQALQTLGEVVVVGPDRAHSGCGHQVTTDRPLDARQLGPNRWSVDGSPADCVRLGLLYIAPDVDFVASGINHGGNLGADVYLSGTVAAAREAALMGRPSAALSHYKRRGLTFDWPTAGAWARHVLGDLALRPHAAGRFWNVNLPHLGSDESPPFDSPPEVVHCPLDLNPLPVLFNHIDGRYHYAGDYHLRTRSPETDVSVCFSGRISATLLSLG